MYEFIQKLSFFLMYGFPCHKWMWKIKCMYFVNIWQLLNVTLLGSDDELAAEGLCIGLPVLQHLNIDTKTFLETNRATIDGADCSKFWNPSTFYLQGTISRLMIARINLIENEIKEDFSESRSPVLAHAHV